MRHQQQKMKHSGRSPADSEKHHQVRRDHGDCILDEDSSVLLALRIRRYLDRNTRLEELRYRKLNADGVENSSRIEISGSSLALSYHLLSEEVQTAIASSERARRMVWRLLALTYLPSVTSSRSEFQLMGDH